MGIEFTEAYAANLVGAYPSAWYPGTDTTPLTFRDESTNNTGFDFLIDGVSSDLVPGTPFTEMQYLKQKSIKYTRTINPYPVWFSDFVKGTMAFTTNMLNKTNFPIGASKRTLFMYGYNVGARFGFGQKASTGELVVYVPEVRFPSSTEATIETNIPTEVELPEFHSVIFSWDFTQTDPDLQWQLYIGDYNARTTGTFAVNNVAGFTVNSGTPANYYTVDRFYVLAEYSGGGGAWPAPIDAQIGNLLFWPGIVVPPEDMLLLSQSMVDAIPDDENDDRVLTHLETAKALFAQQFRNVREFA